MNEACPVSIYRVDGNVARLNGFAILALAVAFAFFREPVIIIFMLLDFTVRGFFSASLSPLSTLNRLALKVLGITSTLTDAAPKMFAARMGVLCTGLIAVLYMLDYQMPLYAVLGLLAFCASLEAFFGYCIGCRIYSFLMKRRLQARQA
jgi:hypothetical protein